MCRAVFCPPCLTFHQEYPKAASADREHKLYGEFHLVAATRNQFPSPPIMRLGLRFPCMEIASPSSVPRWIPISGRHRSLRETIGLFA
jgi:hypothetical protein